MNKLSSVRVLPRNPIAPGTGVLVVQGWTGAFENLEVAILENQQGHCLQLDGAWQSKECWFSCPFVLDADSGELRINVGNFLVNPLLLSGSSVVHQLKLRVAGDPSSQASRVLQPDRNLLSAPAAGQSDTGCYVFELPQVEKPAVVEPVSQPLQEHVPEPVPAVVTPVQEPQVVPPAPAIEVAPVISTYPLEKKSKKFPVALAVLALLVLLAAITAAVWWFVLRTPGNAPEPEAEVVETSEPAAPADAAPCSVEAMGASGEMAFVQACVAQSPSSDELLQTIQSAKQAGHCGIAQRLYANRAQAGDMNIALAYAKEYDPQFHQASDCFKAPEVDTAVYWWETIVGFDANNELAAQRLKELKP